MVALKEVRSANSALDETASKKTAVFIGATNLQGIGYATLQAFAKHTSAPRAIIIGRNASSFAPGLAQLRQFNPRGRFTFLDADVSLLKSIGAICEDIKSELGDQKLDLLYLSQGSLPFAGRKENSEGLDTTNAVRYYGRVRFTQNLISVMSSHARVISIMGGTQEGKMLEHDLELSRPGNYSLTQSNNQIASMMTLSFDHLAKENPDKSFIHVFPGLVSSGILARSATGILNVLFAWVVEPMLGLFVAKADGVGERMFYYGTSAVFAEGSWALDEAGVSKEVDVLKEYRAGGWAGKIWEHNLSVFERVVSK
ncbi:hypothetical protein LTR78_009758 [Recurvomyces mirabilis]|uniref:NAD(P)-binding protein n=1 Tax=Recurvomyces mirabilis TaxID=574656 RepID=A0AAE0WID4_9PEZI|nr:hypothetical protein LTR78_009758 [Recurvomyces mirabilis]KAK5156381.1 hypothetical protein LTS14_005269 [Recurvomyces mirabilis]